MPEYTCPRCKYITNNIQNMKDHFSRKIQCNVVEGGLDININQKEYFNNFFNICRFCKKTSKTDLQKHYETCNEYINEYKSIELINYYKTQIDKLNELNKLIKNKDEDYYNRIIKENKTQIDELNNENKIMKKEIKQLTKQLEEANNIINKLKKEIKESENNIKNSNLVDFYNLLNSNNKMKKGSLFEKFCVSLLVNYIHKNNIEYIYLHNQIPISIKTLYKHINSDQGIDIIYKLRGSIDIYAVQCKYLSDRNKCITHKMIGSFIAVSTINNFKKVLFTTSNKVKKINVIESIYDGNYIDSINKNDLEIVLKNINDDYIVDDDYIDYIRLLYE